MCSFSLPTTVKFYISMTNAARSAVVPRLLACIANSVERWEKVLKVVWKLIAQLLFICLFGVCTLASFLWYPFPWLAFHSWTFRFQFFVFFYLIQRRGEHTWIFDFKRAANVFHMTAVLQTSDGPVGQWSTFGIHLFTDPFGKRRIQSFDQ